MFIDIHSHRPAPYPEGVVSLMNLDLPLQDGQAYSAGIHPWNSNEEFTAETMKRLEDLACKKNVVMIGECGVDLLKGAPLFRQLQILKFQIELSERVEKPLILHCVKSADIILGLKRDLSPVQPWIIHGFRGKPALAKQLTDKGIYLSFGENFNSDTLMQMPDNLILAETDESILTIDQIISRLSVSANRDIEVVVRENIQSLFPVG